MSSSATVNANPSVRNPQPARFRTVVADAVKRSTVRTRCAAILHRHLRALHAAIPARLRGAATARAIVLALERAVSERIRGLDGTAVQIVATLMSRGHLILAREPTPLSAGCALSILASLSPVFRRIAHGRFLVVVRPGDETLAELDDLGTPGAITGLAKEHVRSGREPDLQAGSDASAAGAACRPLSVQRSPHKEHAPEVLLGGDVPAPSDDRRGLRSGSEGKAASAGPAPNDPRLRPPRKRVGLATAESFTPSGWMQALTGWKHLQRAGLLCLRHLPASGFSGDAAALAGWLAPGLRWRGREALVRGLRALERRGCLEHVGGVWRLPELLPHEAMAVLDVDAPASPVRPSRRMARRLERAGIAARGLGQHEAKRIHQRLWSRAQDCLPTPRLLARVVDALGDVGIDVPRRRLGRAEAPELLRLLEQAHADRVWMEGPYAGP